MNFPFIDYVFGRGPKPEPCSTQFIDIMQRAALVMNQPARKRKIYRRRNEIDEFMDLVRLKRNLISFFRNHKNGKYFLPIFNEFKRVVSTLKNKKRIEHLCRLVYDHAFKYNHYAFIKHFVTRYYVEWSYGLEKLCKANISSKEFQSIFKCFQNTYVDEYMGYSVKNIKQEFSKSCVYILKHHSWDVFFSCASVYSKTMFSDVLIQYALKSKIDHNKLMQLMEWCTQNFMCYKDLVSLRSWSLWVKCCNNKYDKHVMTLIMYGFCCKKAFSDPAYVQLYDEANMLLFTYCVTKKNLGVYM
jgi:hypothetical protein